MDPIKTGMIIRQLRTERHLTQSQLADKLHVSDKAVSKWECGGGCPDLSLLSALAEVLDTDIRVLLSGEMHRKESEKGNMKKLKFYICGHCGNIITATSEASVTCCGSLLTAQEPREAAENERLQLDEIDGEWYVTTDHEMTKDHYISFVAYVNDRTVNICKQYPEWNLQATFPLTYSGKIFWYCSKCGLLSQNIRRSK